ncbi:transmembrane protein 87A-like [Sesamum indicum]|uniref:Transmembrane protein 87A-like n=1 Tax=Sesamum indicum TaxID=4182 RepID=A0A8M8VB00_SESIN|nr:transmembrane protein 87A-like [Sesamum indicum]XP_020553484.1 transmembrane protein 87A-like [Sesamum indicum]
MQSRTGLVEAIILEVKDRERIGDSYSKSGMMWKNVVKLELYRKFTNSLAVFVLVAIAWLYFNASDPLNELWRIVWIIPAFWIVLAFFLLAVVCVLWAPSHHRTRYA